MSQQLINHSPDLQRLRVAGYEIDVYGGYLIVHHIPYVNSSVQIQYGKLITALNLNGNQTARPPDHVIQFMGEHPCHRDGVTMVEIQHASPNTPLFDNLVMNHSFSNKPPDGYPDYYEKIARYEEMISAPARALDPAVTAKTYKALPSKDEVSVFHYIDTNGSRANLYTQNQKLAGQKIGIIGLGGTGSYILDQVAKTAVEEIHLFDADIFHQHNAFRCPGAPSIEDLDRQLPKVDYLTSVYARMHKGIFAHRVFITSENLEMLSGLTYIFICVDSNRVRGEIIAYLISVGISFIDCGLGVDRVDDMLIGTVRVTSATPAKHDHLSNRIGTVDRQDDLYASNIQIADLNALNAQLAVLKWKKLSGFYQDLNQEHHTTYIVNTAQIINDDYSA